MLPARQVTDRLLRSRRLYWAFKMPFGPWRGGTDIEVSLIQTEIGLLNDLARAHPDRANKIFAMIDLWEGLMVERGAKAN